MDRTPQPIRLLRSYRGYRSGTVIQVTPDLAGHLISRGLAAWATDEAPTLFEKAERAVAAPHTETR